MIITHTFAAATNESIDNFTKHISKLMIHSLHTRVVILIVGCTWPWILDPLAGELRPLEYPRALHRLLSSGPRSQCRQCASCQNQAPSSYGPPPSPPLR